MKKKTKDKKQKIKKRKIKKWNKIKTHGKKNLWKYKSAGRHVDKRKKSQPKNSLSAVGRQKEGIELSDRKIRNYKLNR